MRRRDQTHPLPLRRLDGFRFDLQTARDDHHAHAFADGEVLNVPAVTHHHDELFARNRIQPFGEGFQAHRADHQRQILLRLRLVRDQQLRRASVRARFVSDDSTRRESTSRLAVGKRNLLSLNKESSPQQRWLASSTGRMRMLRSSIRPERLRGGAIRRHAQHADCITSRTFGRNIGHELGRRHAKGFQHEIDPVVRVAAARRHGFGHARAPLELRVADGGTNGVRVGIAMADDQYFTHVVKEECVVVYCRSAGGVLASLTDRESLANRSRFTS